MKDKEDSNEGQGLNKKMEWDKTLVRINNIRLTVMTVMVQATLSHHVTFFNLFCFTGIWHLA